MRRGNGKLIHGLEMLIKALVTTDLALFCIFPIPFRHTLMSVLPSLHSSPAAATCSLSCTPVLISGKVGLLGLACNPKSPALSLRSAQVRGRLPHSTAALLCISHSMRAAAAWCHPRTVLHALQQLVGALSFAGLALRARGTA